MMEDNNYDNKIYCYQVKPIDPLYKI